MAFSVLRSVLLKSARETILLKTIKNQQRFISDSNSNVLVDICKCSSWATMTFNRFQSHHSHIHQHAVDAKSSQKLKHDYKQVQSESETDSDLEVLGHRGESEFWRRKIRTFHGILDVNKDGVISYDDFKLLSMRFIDLGHLSEKHIHEFTDLMRNLWEKRWGEITPYNLVTVEQYLEDMHHILNDKRLVRKAHSFLPYLFRAVDKDGSGTISLDEFKLFFGCLGLEESDAVLAFRAIDSNGDGKITINEFVKHGRDFFLTEDENRISKYFFGPLIEH